MTSFTRLILITLVVYALICGALVGVLLVWRAERETWFASVLFMVAVAALFIGYTLLLRSRMNVILDKLSLTVQSLINGRVEAEFPLSQDNLLSKLQDQIIKLSGILMMRQTRYKEEGEEVKTLISDITHQLRTPLANLNMYLEWLADEGLQEDKRIVFARIAKDQTEKLTWLMEGMVKISRLESAIIQLRPEPGNAANTVLAALKTAYPAAAGKGVALKLAGTQDIPLLHDAKWTAEAVFNVLDNAIKYSPSGGEIRVYIQSYEMFVRIDIADDGPGISEAEHARVFQRFYRGEVSQGTPGVGIGLYLSRKIVSDQGGYMKVTSSAGEGSTFSMFLPLLPK